MGMTERLRDVTRALLDPKRPAYTLRAEILELKSLFETASGKRFNDGDANIASGEISTSGGLAISPAMAAMCVDDFARTVQFIRGVHDAINDAGATVDRPVQVLYAGCGPWATLATPLMALLGPNKVRFRLIDMHEQSIRSVRTMLDALALSDRIESIETADATSYRIQSTPDIIIVEMMRSALEAEPQVAVAMNLMAQTPNAILIPSEISVNLALVDPAREFSFDTDLPDRDRIDIGPVICLNKQTLAAWNQLLQPVSFRLPDFDEARYRPMLLTKVNVYGDHVLSDYDSGITAPVKLPIKKAACSGGNVELRYEISCRPGLRVRFPASPE